MGDQALVDGPVSRILWGVRAYVLLAAAWVRVSLSYRASFAVMVVAGFAITSLDFIAILILFSAVETLGGFGLAEVAFLYGASSLCLGVADLLLGEIERLGQRIRLGTVDTMLLRPVPLFAQVAADRFALRRIGRVAQALAVWVWAIAALGVSWTPLAVVMLPYMVVCGSAIFGAIFTLGAAFQFWTTDAAQAANAFTYGGDAIARYPLTIYPTGVVKLLTFVVPVGFVSWYPSLVVLGRSDPLGLPDATRFASPVVAAALCLLAGLAWRAGVRRYQSTGS